MPKKRWRGATEPTSHQPRRPSAFPLKSILKKPGGFSTIIKPSVQYAQEYASDVPRETKNHRAPHHLEHRLVQYPESSARSSRLSGPRFVAPGLSSIASATELRKRSQSQAMQPHRLPPDPAPGVWQDFQRRSVPSPSAQALAAQRRARQSRQVPKQATTSDRQSSKTVAATVGTHRTAAPLRSALKPTTSKTKQDSKTTLATADGYQPSRPARPTPERRRSPTATTTSKKPMPMAQRTVASMFTLPRSNNDKNWSGAARSESRDLDDSRTTRASRDDAPVGYVWRRKRVVSMWV